MLRSGEVTRALTCLTCRYLAVGRLTLSKHWRGKVLARLY